MTERSEPNRAVYYAREAHQFELILHTFLQRSAARTVFLVDEAGHLMARAGHPSPADEDTVTALVAGTFQAAQALAQVLGTNEFSSRIPCGEDTSILVLRVGDRALLAVVFSDDVSAPLLRTYALEAIRRLLAVIEGPRFPDDRIQGQRFDRELDGVLDSMFG